ncbi:xanthine dehydrogenase family protein subunit M [Actinoallomurus purpureus]|uniref:FAD binding domain-containing protein n=1 Tax=Actinoallomurus purpureus TaxID=478114 RepID=UPI002093E630|nr:xanthine dehydrogenase family protein subunit M [Actinoallomurus purpureus]MCO6004661.1 xanthine dehydrogenase family protein subunit M [Actinoallomurus purpureus]
MIPAPFDYVRPSTLNDAVTALREADEEGKVLAGGQSLMPLLRLRLAYPEVLIDVSGLPELRGVRDDGDSIVVGAMATHYEVMRDPLVQAHAPLLAAATSTVADPAVRHRGTFGGSLAHADPAGDLPAVVLTMDGLFVTSAREIPARDFFADYLTSALEPDEILLGVRLPKTYTGWGFHYEKFHRTAQAWAVVGVACLVRRTDGEIAHARIGLTNMGSTPVRAYAVETAVADGPASREAFQSAARDAPDGTNPPSDLHGSAEYRRHLAQVLTARALATAAGV